MGEQQKILQRKQTWVKLKGSERVTTPHGAESPTTGLFSNVTSKIDALFSSVQSKIDDMCPYVKNKIDTFVVKSSAF